MANVYVGSVEYTAVAAWAATHAYAANAIVRQTAPAVGSERVFKTTAGGTSGGAEPVWVTTAGSTTTPADGTIPTGATGWVEVTGLNAGAWNTPHARLGNAFASGWSVAGDDFWVADDHAETTATSPTLTAPGTAASPNRIICVNHAGSVPPVSVDLATTATLTCTGTNAFAMGGYFYCYGITFNNGTGAGSAGFNAITSAGDQTFENCKIKMLCTGAGSLLTIGNGTSNTSYGLTFINTPVTFSQGAQGINALMTGRFVWKATPNALAGTAPTTLFQGSTRQGLFLISGCDFSFMSAGTLVGVAPSPSLYVFTDCKVGATTTLSAVPTSTAGQVADFINVNNGAVNYANTRVRYQGTLTTDSGVVRTGGASDGTTPISWKVVTTANNKVVAPFECFEIDQWVDTTGAHTVTVEVLTSAVTLTNADIWVEVMSLDTAGAPVATRHSSGPADPLAAGSNLATSTETWTGLGSPSPQKCVTASFTTALKGFVRARVYVSKVSATIYVDPKITIT